MIKDPSDLKRMTITVKLRNGQLFANKDTTARPFGESERVVAFWQDGVIRTYPMDLVEYVELNGLDF